MLITVSFSSYTIAYYYVLCPMYPLYFESQVSPKGPCAKDLFLRVDVIRTCAWRGSEVHVHEEDCGAHVQVLVLQLAMLY